MRAHDLAAVGQRRVDDGQLQRRHLDVALADREVDVVADRPRIAVGDPAPARRRRVLGAAVPALELARAVDLPVGVAKRAGRVLALQLQRVAGRSPRGRRQRARHLARQVDPGVTPDPELPRPLLQRPALRHVDIGERAEVVEEDVVGDPDRAHQVDDAVGGVTGVVQAVRRPREAELAGVVIGVVDQPIPALQRRGGGDHLERRAGRPRALVGAVEQRVAVVRVDQLLVGRLRQVAAGEHRRVVAGQRAHAVDLAAVRVERHERPAGGRVEAHRLLQRVLADPLQLHVERGPQVVAGLRRLAGQVAGRLAERVDLDLLLALRAAQEAVVLVLQAGLADDRVRRHGAIGLHVVLGGVDRPDRSEHLRGQVAERVVGHVHAFHLHAGELRLALGQVVLNVGGDDGPALDRHVGIRQQRDLLADVAGDRRQPVDVGGRHVQLAADPLGRHAQHVGEPVVDDRVGARRVLERGDVGQRGRNRQVRRGDLHRERAVAVDQHVAAAVEDLAARSGDGDLAHPVVGGLCQVLVARQDLQEPQAEEDDREHRQRDAADDRHPQRELRGQRRTALLGRRRCSDHRPLRLIVPRRCDGLCSGDRPPVVYARRRRRRGSSGSAGVMIRRTSA